MYMSDARALMNLNDRLYPNAVRPSVTRHSATSDLHDPPRPHSLCPKPKTSHKLHTYFYAA